MNAPDPMDDMLRELGEGTPFSFDKARYERQLMQRMWQRQAAVRSRLLWRAVFGGMAIGAVAAFMLTVLFLNRSAGTNPEPVVKQVPPVQPVRAPEMPVKDALKTAAPSTPSTNPHSDPTENQPGSGEIVRILRRKDGRMARVVAKDNLTQNVEPFSRRTRRADGKLSEVTFEGFSEPDAGKPTVVATVKPARTSR